MIYKKQLHLQTNIFFLNNIDYKFYSYFIRWKVLKTALSLSKAENKTSFLLHCYSYSYVIIFAYIYTNYFSSFYKAIFCQTHLKFCTTWKKKKEQT